MATKAFIGGWADPTTAARLRALAQLRGLSQSEVLRRLVDAAAAKAGAVADDPPGLPEETHNRADGILADAGAVVSA
jgi:hypothetical protein